MPPAIPQEAKDKIAEITQRYRGEMSQEAFAEFIGMENPRRATVSQWERAYQTPDGGFLWETAVNQSGPARDWAVECLVALGYTLPGFLVEQEANQ